jgi:hypothetical protein
VGLSITKFLFMRRKKKEAIPADNRRNNESRVVLEVNTATATMVLLEEWGALCFVLCLVHK